MTDDGGSDVDLEGWSCPLPLRHTERIVMGHGGGGRMSAELVEHLFRPAFGTTGELHDAATIDLGAAGNGAGRLAFSTDSYVVQPLFFPGGCIGDLAVNGTINDVAMSGARPIALSCGFVVAEGTELATLGRIAEAMGAAASVAGVPLVTGDTKVIDAVTGDGVYVNTAGIGVIPEGVDIRPTRAAPGDIIIVSGPIGEHGIAVMSQREGLEFGTEVCSDSQALAGLVGGMLAACPDLHVLRDPTRGGLTATLCEIATAAQVGVEYEEALVPVPDAVAAACSFLGLDPMDIANEGKLAVFVAEQDADAVLSAMHAHPAGAGATVIGRVVAVTMPGWSSTT
ncbi:MAG: hydrogenase expression/formation protein HypE, partial [Ilumatobacter sp.]|uniref:hydrogenase expression/formation protein HypE n=1 Tax=Ilumatobacter sp. TaxID=1967498 RepID=UPI00261043C1